MCIIKKILKSTEEKYFSYFFVAVGFFVVFYISQFCQSIFFFNSSFIRNACTVKSGKLLVSLSLDTSVNCIVIVIKTLREQQVE